MVGGGRVAKALAEALVGAGVDVTVAVREPSRFVPPTEGVRVVRTGYPINTDYVIIAVSDDALATVSSHLADIVAGCDVVVAHTSGTVPLEALDGRLSRRGVFYPLLSFTGEGDDFRKAPLLLEGEDEDTLRRLQSLADTLGTKWCVADSEKRGKVHLAAVFANNFVCRMQSLAKELCDRGGVDYELLKPLIVTAAEKMTREGVDPHDCQTGPAARGDLSTIERHRSLLGQMPETLAVYDIVTESIMNEKNKK